MLYSTFLRQWPSKDFGTFIDHFGAFTKKGITKKMYQALAMSLFSIADYEPGIQLWWQNPMRNSTGSDSSSYYNQNDSTGVPEVYPLPQRLANLLQLGDTFKSVDYKAMAHPSFLQNLSTDQLIKIFKFELWAKYMQHESGDFDTLSDVIKAEINTFSKSGFNLREDFQVQFILITLHLS